MCLSRRHSEFRDRHRADREAWRQARREARRRWRESFEEDSSDADDGAPSPGHAALIEALTRAVDRLAGRIEVLERVVVDDESRLAREIDSLHSAGPARTAGQGQERRAP